ncbi:MAG TPA: DUF302 domain-containing protein [Chryseolinea sp.]|nr:DUF302 domain-containing protein [Chryseolinea sp.]
MAYYSRKFKMPFQEVLEKITENLENQGFAVITTIDFRDAFKRKLNIRFRNFGSCNTLFAYEALSQESHMLAMLPCNIVIQEHETGEVEVSANNPLEDLQKPIKTTYLVDLATEIGIRLRAAVACVQRRPTKVHQEPLTIG